MRGKRSPVERTAGVYHEEMLRGFLAEMAGDVGIGLIETRRAVPGVVSVAGDEMRQAALDQRLREALCFRAEPPEERLRRDLKQQPSVYPSGEVFQAGMEQPVAFRMGQDGAQPAFLQAIEQFGSVAEDDDVRKLDQNVVFAVDGVASGVGSGVGDAIRVEMIITAEVNFRQRSGCRLELFHPGGADVAVKGVIEVGVGGCDNVRRPMTRGDPCHFEADFKGSSSVVKFPEDMAVNVDHKAAPAPALDEHFLVVGRLSDARAAPAQKLSDAGSETGDDSIDPPQGGHQPLV